MKFPLDLSKTRCLSHRERESAKRQPHSLIPIPLSTGYPRIVLAGCSPFLFPIFASRSASDPAGGTPPCHTSRDNGVGRCSSIPRLSWTSTLVRSFEFVEILKDVVDLLSPKRASAPICLSLALVSKLLSSPLFSYTYDTLASRLLLPLSLFFSPLSRTVQIQSWFERILSSWDERRKR